MDEIPVERIKSEYKIKTERFCCGICNYILSNVAKCAKCPKHYCRHCYLAYLQLNDNICPSCKKETEVAPAEHYLIEDLEELPIECEFENCKKVVYYKNLEEHQENCEFNPAKVKEVIHEEETVELDNSKGLMQLSQKINKISEEVSITRLENNQNFKELNKKIETLHELIISLVQNSQNSRLNVEYPTKKTINNNEDFDRKVNLSTLSNNDNQKNKEDSIIDEKKNHWNKKNNLLNQNSELNTPNKLNDSKAFNNSNQTNNSINKTNQTIKTQVVSLGPSDLNNKCIFLYFCRGKSKGCKSTGDVWGSNPYTCDTDPCRAGIHSSLINETGGNYLIAYGGPFNNFSSSQKNGIVSSAWESENNHFIVTSSENFNFDLSKFNYDKCGFYIGFCQGKGNGCCFNGNLTGSNPYTSDSNLCCSALHSGIIDQDGGYFGIYHGGAVNKFIGSSNNGLVSEKGGYNSSSFSIKKY